MKSYFLKPIKSKYQATRFITQLHRDGLLFHFDDPPNDIGNHINGEWIRTFTDEEAEAIDARVDEMFALPDYCPFGKALEVMRKFDSAE